MKIILTKDEVETAVGRYLENELDIYVGDLNIVITTTGAYINTEEKAITPEKILESINKS